MTEKAITIAHFRRAWFLKTETFLYNYISNFKATRPLLIGYTHENQTEFPVSCPVVTLYDKGIGLWWERRIRPKLLGYRPPPFACFKTYRAIAKAGVCSLHAHFGYTGYYVLPVKRRTNLPLITTFYGEDISRQPEEPLWKQRYAELFDKGDLFLVEGPFMKQRLIEIGCRPEKAAIQRIAIRVERYPFRLRSPKNKSDPVRILFCAAFREKKGLEYALKAVARAQKVYTNIEFYIAGDGKLRPQIEAIIQQQQMAPYTRLLGFISHERMIEEMSLADIFIHPSVTAENGDSEGGAPTTILEAQACGMPVLTTYHADIPNIVRPEESALLAPERDVDALSNNLMTLLNDQDRWYSMGRAGRSFVEMNHNVTSEVKRLEETYYSLAEGNKASGGL